MSVTLALHLSNAIKSYDPEGYLRSILGLCCASFLSTGSGGAADTVESRVLCFEMYKLANNKDIEFDWRFSFLSKMDSGIKR